MASLKEVIKGFGKGFVNVTGASPKALANIRTATPHGFWSNKYVGARIAGAAIIFYGAIAAAGFGAGEGIEHLINRQQSPSAVTQVQKPSTTAPTLTTPFYVPSTTTPPTQQPTASPTTAPPKQEPTAPPTTSPPTQQPTVQPTTPATTTIDSLVADFNSFFAKADQGQKIGMSFYKDPTNNIYKAVAYSVVYTPSGQLDQALCRNWTYMFKDPKTLDALALQVGVKTVPDVPKPKDPSKDAKRVDAYPSASVQVFGDSDSPFVTQAKANLQGILTTIKSDANYANK